MAISALRQGQIKELRNERNKLVMQAREINDKALAEKRKMSREEEGSWDEIMKKVDEYGERLDALERQAEAEGDDDEDRDEEEDEDRDEEDGDEEGEDEDEDEDDGKDRANRPRWIKMNGKRYLVVPNGKTPRNRTQPGGGSGRTQYRKQHGESEVEYRTRMRRSTPEYASVFFDYMYRGDVALNTPLARRAIQADSDIVGGYLVAPQEFTGQLIKFVNNFLFVRKLATVYTLKTAQSLGTPSLDTDPDDADWTAELDTGNEDNAMSFGKRELTPRPLAKRVKISNKVLRMAAISGGFSADNSVAGGGPEGLVRDRLGYKFGVAEEKAFLTGTGANQALGVFVASSRGISTARDVVTGNPNGFTVDGLIGAKYNQKVQYWPTLQWCFHRQGLKLIRQLKDANGQYLWVPSGMGGESDTLLDCKVNMSEYAPNVFSSGNYAGILGDWRFYWIADALSLEIQRLNELYAAANLTGFIARMEVDGMPVLEEAFTRLKCG